MKRSILWMAASLMALTLGGCGSSNSGGGGTASSSMEYIGPQVDQRTWDKLFDLSNIALHSNYKMTAEYYVNDDPIEWDSSVSVDYGKMLVTGIGLSGQPMNSDGSTESVEQRDYEYFKVKSVKSGVMKYDEYRYWNGWIVSAQERNAQEFFQGYGLFSLNYADFTYHADTEEYVGVLSGYGYETHVAFESQGIARIDYIASTAGQTSKISYSFSDYGNVTVTLPADATRSDDSTTSEATSVEDRDITESEFLALVDAMDTNYPYDYARDDILSEFYRDDSMYATTMNYALFHYDEVSESYHNYEYSSDSYSNDFIMGFCANYFMNFVQSFLDCTDQAGNPTYQVSKRYRYIDGLLCGEAIIHAMSGDEAQSYWFTWDSFGLPQTVTCTSSHFSTNFFARVTHVFSYSIY